ncbi:MAG: AsmA-like C-terminal region-containing protein [Terriglobales bacterium]
MAIAQARTGPAGKTLLVVISLVVIAVVALIVTRIHLSNPYLRKKVVEILGEKFHAQVELKDFHVYLFPGVRIEGSGLVLRHEGRTDVPPLISIGEFSAQAGILGLIGKPWKIRQVRLQGLTIQIPPKEERMEQDWSKARDLPILIGEIVSDDAELRLLPKSADKNPHVFAIHHLVMHSVGLHRPAQFTAELTNAIPPGEIATEGTFGPWSPDDPGQTPLAAEYRFDKADLGVFKGISGILSSTGKFGGVLEKIEVEGKTSTPDFTVTIGGHPLDLETVFNATVDGTNGDTLLHPVTARLLNTVIVAHGGIVRARDNLGKEITLDVTVEQGRIEDLLRLAVKADKPPLTGAINFHTKFDLPPGPGDLSDRLNLNGTFDVERAQFTSPDVTAKIETLSRKGQGQPENMNAGSSVSELNGNFVLDNGVITFRGLKFTVTGAQVALNGTYDLDKGDLDFHGKLRMQAKISQTTTGAKAFVLKFVDPFFRKDGQTELPIKITGEREHPAFGLDFGHKDKDKEKEKGE